MGFSKKSSNKHFAQERNRFRAGSSKGQSIGRQCARQEGTLTVPRPARASGTISESSRRTTTEVDFFFFPSFVVFFFLCSLSLSLFSSLSSLCFPPPFFNLTRQQTSSSHGSLSHARGRAMMCVGVSSCLCADPNRSKASETRWMREALLSRSPHWKKKRRKKKLNLFLVPSRPLPPPPPQSRPSNSPEALGFFPGNSLSPDATSPRGGNSSSSSKE